MNRPRMERPVDDAGISESPPVITDQEWRQDRTAAIRKFISAFAPGENEDLLGEMLVTICRLAADGADRGDVKILNSALKELRYAFKVFAPYSETRKVTIFGSARTPEEHPQYNECKKFAELMQGLGWMIITGAGGGIMQAGHHGASREASFGVAISLPFEQATNTYITDDPKLVNFKYFFTRKLMFIKEAHAIALFPGGFGTLDEGFESLTLVQTLKSVLIPVVMCEEPGGRFWAHWRSYVESQLLGHGMIDPEDLGLFSICDRAEDAMKEIVKFYRRYHSSRYVGEQLVLRLNSPISAAALDQLNASFSSILLSGRIEQMNHSLPLENGAYPDKPRLVLAFNRRNAGGLRQLVNALNEPD